MLNVDQKKVGDSTGADASTKNNSEIKLAGSSIADKIKVDPLRRILAKYSFELKIAAICGEFGEL